VPVLAFVPQDHQTHVVIAKLDPVGLTPLV
jgi:hypothetical protein